MRLSEEMTIYYLFLFISTFLMAIFIFAMDAQATDSTVYNASTKFPAQYTYAGSLDYVHTKDDYIATAFEDDSGNLMVAYRKWGVSTWTYHQVAAFDDLHDGPWRPYGMVCTSNGSVCIGTSTSQGGTYQNRVYLWTKFPANDWDDWDYEPITTSTWHYYGTIGINDTDVIMFLFKYGGAGPFDMFYETFDFQAYSLGHALGAGHDTTLNPTNVIRVMANSSGYFHMFYRDGSGIDRYRKWDSGPNTAIDGSNSYQVHDAWFMPNDMLVACGGQSSGHRFWWYQTDYFTSLTRLQISTDATTWSYGTALQAIGGVGADYTVRVVSFNNAGGDLRAYTWSAAWNGTQIAWQNSVQEADIQDPDSIRFVGGCKHMFPRDGEGRMWVMPTDGWTVMGLDEDGATDEHRIYFNDTKFWADLTTDPPQITTASLSQGTVGSYYTFTISASDGTTPYNWSSLTLPAWLSLGAVNGTLYGMPPASGTYIVSVRLADAIPRYDTESWNLKVVPQPSIDQGEDWEISIPDFIGPLWWMFIIFCVFVALFDLIRKNTG